MKKSISDILGGCAPAELDSAAENLGGTLPDGAEDRISALAMERAGISDAGRIPPAPDGACPDPTDGKGRIRQNEPEKKLRGRLLLVAALALLIAVTLVGCYVTDAVEYNRAVEFFDLNELSTDGLDRGEIKRVYRDITTESFTYDKSAEVLSRNAGTDTIQGVDISIRNYANNNWITDNVQSGEHKQLTYDAYREESVRNSEGAEYLYGCEYVESFGNIDYEDTYFEKYIDGEPIWRAGFEKGFYIAGYAVSDGRVYVYGDVTADISRDLDKGYIAVLDDSDGKVIKEFSAECGYREEQLRAAGVNDSGEAAVFGVACDDWGEGDRYLTYRMIDADGNIVKEKFTLFDGLASIDRVTALSGGWLAEVSVMDGATFMYSTRLLRLSTDGEPAQELNYGVEGVSYEISDLFEYDGRIIISATARPDDSAFYSGWDGELGDDGTMSFGGYSEKWRDKARKEFSAVLFVIDSDSGAPGQFYNVGGALAQEIGVDGDGRLTWGIGRIIAAGFSPYTSSYSIYGVTRRYEYTFDRNENLLKQQRTDIIGGFRR